MISKRLLRRALKLAGAHSDAWDLVQAALERGLRRWPGSLNSPDAQRWLYRVLNNLYVDEVRSARCRRGPSFTPELVASIPAPEPDEIPPWRTVDTAEVLRAMRLLTPVERRLLWMQSLRRMSFREMSVAVGLKPATIGVKVHRARRKLRSILRSATAVA